MRGLAVLPRLYTHSVGTDSQTYLYVRWHVCAETVHMCTHY